MIPPVTPPPPVRPGDRVGVAALSGPVPSGALARGLRALADLGFEPVPAPNLELVHGPGDGGLFAGTVEERVEGLHRLAADPSIAAVIFARGGHGVLPALPHVDWDLLARHPRAWVGYSDLTPFLLQVVQRLGWVAFHGPMVASDLGRGLEAVEAQSLVAALAGRWPRELALGGGRGDDAEGPLLGGCLSLLAATLGTPWAAGLEDALLLWEEVDEPLYRLDRMLTQLELSNSLTALRGMVVGHAVAPGRGVTPDQLVTWLQAPDGPAGRLGKPLGWGLEAGHGVPNRTLPLGLSARLEPGRRRLLLAGSA